MFPGSSYQVLKDMFDYKAEFFRAYPSIFLRSILGTDCNFGMSPIDTLRSPMTSLIFVPEYLSTFRPLLLQAHFLASSQQPL